MALTATASLTTRNQIYPMLGLHPPILIYVPPVKKNIIYSVKPKSTIEQLVCKLATSLMQFKHNFPKIIIFCHRYEECSEF